MARACSLWVGFDPREATAYAVTRSSIQRHLNWPVPVHGLVLSELQKLGLYRRPTQRRLGKLWDEISGAPMATEFAVSRFLVPALAETGWAVFTDCDMLCRASLSPTLHRLDPKYAVYCVKHEHSPANTEKMDGQVQTSYPRKNWSSFLIFNCDHPANKSLTIDEVNTRRGLELHQLFWLDDSQIGELDASHNWLVGHSDPSIEPKMVHFTDGGPWLSAFENVPYADEWRAELNRWAA